MTLEKRRFRQPVIGLAVGWICVQIRLLSADLPYVVSMFCLWRSRQDRGAARPILNFWSLGRNGVDGADLDDIGLGIQGAGDLHFQSGVFFRQFGRVQLVDIVFGLQNVLPSARLYAVVRAVGGRFA